MVNFDYESGQVILVTPGGVNLTYDGHILVNVVVFITITLRKTSRFLIKYYVSGSPNNKNRFCLLNSLTVNQFIS